MCVYVCAGGSRLCWVIGGKGEIQIQIQIFILTR